MEMNFVTQYQQVSDAISAALVAATDAKQVEALLAERDVARSAYTKATLQQLTTNDAGMQAMSAAFTAAAQGLSNVSEATSDIVSYLGKIQTAVGWLAKIATYAV